MNGACAGNSFHAGTAGSSGRSVASVRHQGLFPKRAAGGRQGRGFPHHLRRYCNPERDRRRRRLASLLAADINLLAYHLPLDVHPVYGNNVQLGELFGWPVQGWGGEVVGSQGIIGWHDLAEESALDAMAVAERLTERLHREPLLVGDLSRPIRRIAWCSGGAQDFLQDAIDLGADCYISGEISERTTHLAREAGVVYAAAGHHATERCGVQALGRHLAETFGIEVKFVDDPNPV